MKESYNEDPIYFPQYNQTKQKIRLDNIESNENNQISQIAVVLHFTSSKSFSLKVPISWTIRKLISFVTLTFKSELKNSIPIFLFKGNIMQPSNEAALKDFLNPQQVNHIIITPKQKEINNIEEEPKNNNNVIDNIYSKSNKEVFKTDEFCEMEKYMLTDYTKIFKEESFNTFPLMSPAYNQRREQIKYDTQTERLAQFEPIPLEDFPIRNYFQLKIIFKIILSFFVFGVYIKGFNFVIFLCILVIYYWYCISNVIEEFYKKKFQTIGLTEEEYKRIGSEIKDIGRKFGSFIEEKDEYEENEEENESEEDNKDDNDNKEENNNEDIIYEEKSDENISNNNINKEANNNNINLVFEEEMKDIEFKEEKKDNIINEPMKDLEFKEEDKKEEINNENPSTLLNNNINNIFNENKNNINMNNDRIKNLNKKIKKKELKKEKEKKEQEEQERETPLQIAYQIIYLFFISFIPPMCDEFEAHNPMPNNNPPPANNNNANNNNNQENLNNINNENNNINNENNINNNLFNNINNDNIDNNTGQQSSNSPPEEDINNNKMTSSKIVNMSEDSSRENRMYNLIKKDNQSLNEKEYVFSENGGIDDLSINSELYKQKKEKEKEKEKENKENKEINEKEEQIFEKEEEKIIDENKIEEEKHLKNE